MDHDIYEDRSLPIQNSNSSRRKMEIRRVSFPETQLVTGYFEPEDPLRLAEDVTTDQIKNAYLCCCKKYNQSPLERVVEQINNMSLDNRRETYFELKDEIITAEMCETFEEIFRRVQFLEVTLNSCVIGDDAAASLFDMIEYYESTIRFKMNISFGIESRGWNAFKRYLTKSQSLTYVEIYSMKFKEKEFSTAVNSLASNNHIETFKLRNCYFENSTTAMIHLAQKLTQNSTLRELYLPNNDLKDKDIKLLTSFIRSNSTLFLLDLSNNDIQNQGADHVFNALVNKNVNDRALSVLILWNNNLDDEVSDSLCNFLKHDYKLEVLNLGHNILKDICVLLVEHDLATNTSLLRLGMQKCELTDIGVMAMCRVIKENKTLERIDFRGNRVTLEGLNAFHEIMQECTTLVQVDFDHAPSDNYNVPVYAQVFSKLNQMCEANKVSKQNETSNTEENKRKKASRKISLTCQTLQRHPACAAAPKTSSGRLRSPQLSPVPSPSTSPKPTKIKSRFSITLVNESKPEGEKIKTSRFTVFNVQEPVKKTVGFNCTMDEPSTSTAPSNGFDKVESSKETEDVIFASSSSDDEEEPCDEVSDMEYSDVSSDGKGSDHSVPEDDLDDNDKTTMLSKDLDQGAVVLPLQIDTPQESLTKTDSEPLPNSDPDIFNNKSAFDDCPQLETDRSSSSCSDEMNYIGTIVLDDQKVNNVIETNIDKNISDTSESEHNDIDKCVLKELSNQVIDLKNNNQFESK